ncbi:hypothetical protein GMDG_06186 [Pseudogymnoascus destructans 20631-21]|uniref:Protein PBN1 n=1 Tax=Pseudogymnoascus destructans (strain ATCC MYA-4855 / 20631-21) TaxID=658429 RepID=L8FSJ9_PSED2|nr:hypothetical protein GMDG_06186 [Pseudogymnoascus destructans 20631-21]
MRQRITFVHEPQDGIDPKSIGIHTNTLSVSGLKAAREDHITLSLDELPQDLRVALSQTKELHIRYVTPASYESIPPFNSQLSPGLHVYYTPKTEVGKEGQEGVYEYYLRESALSPAGGASALQSYFKRICASTTCRTRIDEGVTAASIDLDFSSSSNTATITTSWSPRTWTSVAVSKIDHTDRVELGILSNEKPIRPDDLNMSGFLTVLGESEKPAPTMFQFPSRHHKHAAKFSSSFIEPTGLHPTLQLSVSNSEPPKNREGCRLNAHLMLPRSVFPDKYQFRDALFMASKNLTALRHVTIPVDLEAPEYTMALWGSSLLIELAPPPPSEESWTAEIPLHLRYLLPSGSGYSSTSLPSPVLFWACEADEESKLEGNPFDRVNLGHDGLFGDKTLFYHLGREKGEEGAGDGGGGVAGVWVGVVEVVGVGRGVGYGRGGEGRGDGYGRGGGGRWKGRRSDGGAKVEGKEE